MPTSWQPFKLNSSQLVQCSKLDLFNNIGVLFEVIFQNFIWRIPCYNIMDQNREFLNQETLIYKEKKGYKIQPKIVLLNPQIFPSFPTFSEIPKNS